jgi:hypothetical protein
MRLFTPSIVGSLLILGLALPPSALAGAGDLDPAFGVGGKVTTDFGFGLAGEDEATDVLKVKANKIVAVGWIFNPDNGTVDFALVRYDKHGNVDERSSVTTERSLPTSGARTMLQMPPRSTTKTGSSSWDQPRHPSLTAIQ